MKYEYIFWDFNGTILDDLVLCVKIINQILKDNNLGKESIAHYRLNFTFPVINYYKILGLNVEEKSFQAQSDYFNSTYLARWEKETRLHKNFLEVANFLQKLEVKQVIASAAKTTNLINQTRTLGIDHFFTNMLGQEGVLAQSKTDYIKKYIWKNNINPKKILLVGDTLHDYQVAQACETKCLLYSKGHQDKSLFADRSVIADLKDILKYL